MDDGGGEILITSIYVLEYNVILKNNCKDEFYYAEADLCRSTFTALMYLPYVYNYSNDWASF